ncbi:histidine phosphatase family protein [Mycolicibacterium parafortuitum]|uniref:Phosphoglycerate mutase [Tsukamurella paurometabola DSM] n=1 Tax=Mycolicibacterium parafortuitum TaxID=39692 RepID=A0A375YHZ0_MYCPF|nr:histidine phosphatase family protein [Mycolicibacterium parafortuitum]ORB30682.1 histidine phosphatase [Mycolicibacterium parafortuitum]SRX80755.1 phosphoglycerate mutase [Tsukamurella paurometabola DSM] [Mycolicibacterium parafortuitum]
MRDPLTRRVRTVLIAALSAVLLVLVSAIPSWAMTLTFVRHAESLANAAGIIDTGVPGPGLSEKGWAQAEAVAPALAGIGFDGVYVSSMLRTQQTAQPMLALLPGSGVQVLPGLREISAGIFEGASEDEGLGRVGYALAPVLWMLGARFLPVPGGEDGNAFDARVDGAIQQIADNGDENAVAFAHSATIMFWVMMNVDNPDLGLMLRHQLDNTESVVIDGSHEEGWTLVSWAGQQVSADPSLVTKLLVNVRDVVVAPQTALYNIGKAFASGDFEALVRAVRDGVVEVTRAVVNFIPDTVRDIADEFRPAASTVTATVAEDTAEAGLDQSIAAAAPQQPNDDESESQSVTVAKKRAESDGTERADGTEEALDATPGDEVTEEVDDETAESTDEVADLDVAESDETDAGDDAPADDVDGDSDDSGDAGSATSEPAAA